MTDQKRKSGHEHVEGQPTKKSKQWRTPKKNQPVREGRTIEPGDAGIWATCNLGKEGKATIELRDLFEEYAVKIYGEDCLTAQTNLPKGTSLEGDDGKEIGNNDLDTEGRTGNEDGDDDHADGGVSLSSPVDDIEAEIAKEVKSIKKTPTGSSASTGKSDFVPLFRAIRIEVQCVLFFKTRPPVEPVSFVRAICQDFADGKAARRSRWVKRLTPMTLMGKATIGGLEDVGRQVLGDVFGKEQGLKFAIRPTIRNSGTMKRDEVIQKVASLVGPGQSVDLKGYDVMILVDIYQNIFGMSVVQNDYDRLRRYNLSELPLPSNESDQNRS